MRTARLPSPAHKQRGAALLLFVIALVMAATYALLKKVNQVPSDALRDSYTMEQLNRARTAVLGYALNGLDPVTATVQPGRLPCPDYTLDGDSDACVIVGGYVQPGRLPWRTLGLSELRDTGNEPLWYVPAIEFNGGQPINSNSDTTALRIDGGADAIVAVVLSAGTVLGTQSRPSGNPVAQIDPARYFEDVNALGATAFVTAPAVSTTPFNDRLLAIRLDRFIPTLEGRVLRELAGLLGSSGPFPNPAPVGTTACDTASPGIKEGLIPLTCAAVTPPGFPVWFNDWNNWQALIWYAMDSSGSLSVLPGSNNAQALLFSPGGLLTGQSRPAAVVSDLLEGTENTDGNTTYEEPVSSPTNNDQMLIVAP